MPKSNGTATPRKPRGKTPRLTVAYAAKCAIGAQNACNVSGIVNTLSVLMSHVLWQEANRLGKGTEWVNTHPITKLFLYKLADLAEISTSDQEDYGRAYEACKLLAAGGADDQIAA